MRRKALPHGAKGISGDSFAIAFGEDKIVLTLKKAGADSGGDEAEQHFTLQFGQKSGVVDLHQTRSFPDGSKDHRTVFALRENDLYPALQQLAPMLPEFTALLRPLRIGWLKHRNIGVARGVDPVSESDVEAVTTKRRKKITVNPELYQRNIYVPEFLEEIYDFPDGNFALFHRNRQIGVAFKTTAANGNVRLFWMKRRDLLRFSSDWQQKVIIALSRIEIQLEDYAHYPFLSRG